MILEQLIGSYDGVMAFGPQRELIIWQRIMLPDGSSMKIDNVQATDASGYTESVGNGYEHATVTVIKDKSRRCKVLTYFAAP